MIVALRKIVKIEIAWIHVQMEIHAIKRPNVMQKIIVQFVHAQPATLEIHLWIVSLNVLNQDHNVRRTAIVQTQNHASIKRAEIHVPNAIHVAKMPNAEQFNIIQRVIVHLDGLEIHKFNATNVRYFSN